MHITNELLKDIYEKARFYVMTQYNGARPYFIELTPGGVLIAEVKCEGQPVLKITAENLAENLDEAKIAWEEKVRQERIKSEERAKANRKEQYEKLKKEFETTT